MMHKRKSPERRLHGKLTSMLETFRDLEASLDPSGERSTGPVERRLASPRRNLAQDLTGNVPPKRSKQTPKHKGLVSKVRGFGMNLLKRSKVKGVAMAEGSLRRGVAERFLQETELLEATTGTSSSRREDARFDSAASCTVLFAPPGSKAGETLLESSTDFWEVLSPLAELGGRYVLGTALWKGNMSRVFSATDRKRGQTVAIKVIPPVLSELVRRSIEAMESLNHPNILRVEDFGDAGAGGLYLVMPFLEGATLRELLFAHGKASEALLLAFRKVCEGLAHAHAGGVVHRDVKPANIQVEPDGQTTVIDWGLACRAGEKAASDQGILGTPLYMAPEQVEGESLTPRTDVYALGTLLYEILTGVHPSGQGKDLSSIFYRIRTQMPPPPSVLGADVAPGFDEVVLRCLRKDPSQRFQDASELLEELEGI